MNPETIKLEVLADRYDAFVLDQFGVLLTGDGAYPFAPNAVRTLSSMGKLVLMLSNSGKRAAANEARLTSLGFDRKDYLGVLSSGEAAFKELSQRIGDTIEPGANVFVLSRDGDTSCIDGLDLALTKDINRADLIIMAGGQGDVISLGEYATMIQYPAEKQIPCFCTNPDMKMLTPQGLRFGNGRIAKLYEEFGGVVEWIGKPHPVIYEIAKETLNKNGAENIICVGDSPAHDISGGHNSGFSTALVRTGIHADESLDEVLNHCSEIDAIPDYILPDFSF